MASGLSGECMLGQIAAQLHVFAHVVNEQAQYQTLQDRSKRWGLTLTVQVAHVMGAGIDAAAPC